MWVQQVTWEGSETLRGFVKDGHFWLNYNTETQEMRICKPQFGLVQWDAPINILRKQVVTCTISVPVTVETVDPWEVVAWATKEKEEQYGS